MDAIVAIPYTLSTYAPFEYAEVLRVEHSTGITPGKAFISIRNVSSTDHASGLVCLDETGDLSPKRLKFWSRIKIMSRGKCIFVGGLMRRRDNIGAQSLTLEYWDDRWLLARIPVRGCPVYDKAASTIKWLTGYEFRTNPNGMHNCTMVGNIPVFAELAEQGTEGQSPYQLIGREPNTSAGVAVAFTPARALNTLRYLAITNLGVTHLGQAILNTTKLQFPVFAFSSTDELVNRKMPDMRLGGMRGVLGALERVLAVTGEYVLNVTYEDSGRCTLGVAATTDSAGNKKTVYLQTSGAAENIQTAFDGVVESDASEAATSGLVEGQVSLHEGRFKFEHANYISDVAATEAAMTASGDHIFPAWDSGEEFGFMEILVNAKDRLGRAIDGLEPQTQAALQLARICYPKVWRAFCVKGPNLATILNGVNSTFVNMPRITSFKQLWDSQLQPYYESRESGKISRGRIRLDIRIEVTDLAATESDGVYHDVRFNSGLRVTDDGLVWFDGLTDDIATATDDNIYTALLLGCTKNDPSHSTYPLLKKIRLNATIKHDTRVFNEYDITRYDPNGVAEELDDSVLPQGSAGSDMLQEYALNEEGYREEHQVTSYPCNNNAFKVTNDTGTGLADLSTPVSKILHQDDSELRDAAKRLLKEKGRVEKSFRLDLIGIRFEFGAGDYIDDIVKQPSGSRYAVGGPASRLVFDFENQKTSLIGSNGAE